MDSILSFGKNYRSYLCGAGIIATVALQVMGILDDSTANRLLTVLGGGGIMALRSAITSEAKKVEAKVEQEVAQVEVKVQEVKREVLALPVVPVEELPPHVQPRHKR